MDSFNSLAALGDTLSAMLGQESLPITEPHISTRTRLAIERALEDNPDDEPAQVDEIAKIRRYFMGDGRGVGMVDACMDGTIDVQETVRQIAEPIERAYSTADGGRLFVYEEEVARNQRTFHSPEKAIEMWGPEENIEKLQARVTDPADAPSVEGELWDLYYTILHASKKVPWSDVVAQQKLVDLLAAIKARPDPQRPANMTTALKRNWIYEWGELWSDLIILGPAGRETWNDSPGCGAGWEVPEISAWVNVNAFVARFTVQEVCNFGIYGSWALQEALEEKIEAHPGHHCTPPSTIYKAEVLFKVAAVWIRLAGRYMHDHLGKESDGCEEENTQLWSRSQWERWQGRFEEEAEKVQYSSEVTRISKECAVIMGTLSATDRVE